LKRQWKRRRSEKGEEVMEVMDEEIMEGNNGIGSNGRGRRIKQWRRGSN
jgi:hypothetical protein